MRTITFDTETTGLKPGNICQLAYIIDDEGTITGKCFFFKVDYVEPGAQRVHGFSTDMLNKLSGGRGFGEFAAQISDDFNSCGFCIAHNYNFDNSFLLAECKRHGISISIKPDSQFCTMLHFTPILKLPRASASGQYKYPTLSELAAFLAITDGEISSLTHKAFGSDGRDKLALYHHDARFDCAAAYLCYKKGVEN